MRSIVIASGNHLCHNPRVIKEATSLSNAGMFVEVIGAWLDPRLKARDIELMKQLPFKYTAVLDRTGEDLPSKLRGLPSRLRSKIGHLIRRHLGVETILQLGPVVKALERVLAARATDLLIAHSEAAMVAARRVHPDLRRVGLDMEDWYSEDLLPEARRGRPVLILRELERELLRAVRYSTCPSKGLSEAPLGSFDCSTPLVLYTGIPRSDRE